MYDVTNVTFPNYLGRVVLKSLKRKIEIYFRKINHIEINTLS